MLNLYKKYINNNISKHKTKSYITKIKNTIKVFPSSTREWNNSIYTFNNNYLNLLPEANKITLHLLKSYFNLYKLNLENKLKKSNVKKRLKKLSSNKIYVSNGTFKHTNNKVIITIFIYNRQKINYTYLIRRKFKLFLTRKLTENLLLIKSKIKNYQTIVDKNKLIVFKELNNELLFNKYKSLFLNYYNLKFYQKIIKKILRKYKTYFLYKQLLYINKSKFNYNYLSYLSTLLKKIYNKNIEFEIMNLKYFYLNSDIFTESILLKIRRNRRNLMRKLKYLIIKTKTNKTSKLITQKIIDKNNINKNKDYISNLILKDLYKNKKTIKRTVLNLINYKKVIGIRLEANGRLTRRHTASRSITKINYKGNLLNIDSSYLGLSSVLLRGNLRSNMQYTKLKSKTRIGSFGLKGWISGY